MCVAAGCIGLPAIFSTDTSVSVPALARGS
jgi:hypothetical protein